MKILPFILMICLTILTNSSFGQMGMGGMPRPTGQSSQGEQKKKPKRTDNFYRLDGIRIGTDISRPFQSYWTKGDRTGFEFSGEFELKPNIFPVIEAGWENFKINQDYVNYKSNGMYSRIGLNYNLLEAKSKDENDILYFGLRYGISLAKQEVKSYTIDNYWGPTTNSFPSQNYLTQWGEIVFGLTTEIFNNIFLGWTIRGKFNISQKNYDTPPVHFTPGFGTGSGMAFDFSYSILYSLPINLHKPAAIKASQ